jgi:hypothetical protein
MRAQDRLSRFIGLSLEHRRSHLKLLRVGHVWTPRAVVRFHLLLGSDRARNLTHGKFLNRAGPNLSRQSAQETLLTGEARRSNCYIAAGPPK